MPIKTPYEQAIELSSKDNLKRGNASVVIQHGRRTIDDLKSKIILNSNEPTTLKSNASAKICNIMKNLNISKS